MGRAYSTLGVNKKCMHFGQTTSAFGRPSSRWEDNIKMILIRYEGVEWIQRPQDAVR
jgi:hypothetical protein